MSKIELLSTEQAAKVLSVSKVTMEKWRGQGKGPEYVKLGRLVKYRQEALGAWLKKNTVHN